MLTSVPRGAVLYWTEKKMLRSKIQGEAKQHQHCSQHAAVPERQAHAQSMKHGRSRLLRERVLPRMPKTLIDLIAQVMNVNIDHVRERFQVVAPHGVGNLRTREYLPWMAHQIFQ